MTFKKGDIGVWLVGRKAGPWDLGSRTFFRKNTDIFG